MKVVRKADVTKITPAKIVALVDRIVEVINPLLENGRIGDFSPEITHLLSGLKPYEVETTHKWLKEVLEQAGWTVTYGYDQRDGFSFVIK
jgi:hypothetical protein